MSSSTIRTEIRGLDLTLDEISLSVVRSGEDLIVPLSLSPEEVERLRLEMAKAQLWEWNQLEGSNSRAVMRYRRYLGSWLVMCLGRFQRLRQLSRIFYLRLFVVALDFSLVARCVYGAASGARGSVVAKLFSTGLGLSAGTSARIGRGSARVDHSSRPGSEFLSFCQLKITAVAAVVAAPLPWSVSAASSSSVLRRRRRHVRRPWDRPDKSSVPPAGGW